MKNKTGSKGLFEVEYEIIDTNKLIGYSKILFNGNQVGTIEELIFIKSYLVNGLERIENSNYLEIDLNIFSPEKMFYNLNNRLKDNNDNEVHKYLINLGSFCDDYTIFSFLNNNKIHILWRLNSNHTPFSDLNLLPTKIFHFSLERKNFKEILDEIKKTILKTNTETH